MDPAGVSGDGPEEIDIVVRVRADKSAHVQLHERGQLRRTIALYVTLGFAFGLLAGMELVCWLKACS
jgi:hypothetical protein